MSTLSFWYIPPGRLDAALNRGACGTRFAGVPIHTSFLRTVWPRKHGSWLSLSSLWLNLGIISCSPSPHEMSSSAAWTISWTNLPMFNFRTFHASVPWRQSRPPPESADSCSRQCPPEHQICVESSASSYSSLLVATCRKLNDLNTPYKCFKPMVN